MTNAMSRENWLSTHVRNMAGVNSDYDVLMMAARRLRITHAHEFYS
jgi:GTPase